MMILFQLKQCIQIVLCAFIFLSQTFSQYDDEPFAQKKANKVYYIDKLNTKPIIDGVLDENCWQTNNYIDDFVQDEPINQSDPSESTKVVILYDNKSIYVGAFLYDSDIGGVPKKIIKRDDWDNSSMTDWFSIEIDSYHDHHNAFEFLVSASGSQFDDIIYDDVSRDGDWDGVWFSDVTFDENGWYVEMEIPINVLRFSNKSEQKWGVNLNRYLSKNNEQISWVVLDREINGIVSHFGHIENLKGLAFSSSTEIRPYYIIGTTNYNDYELLDTNKINFGFSQLDSISLIQKIGVDIKKHLNSNSILDVTINPDFGQVESDPENINLVHHVNQALKANHLFQNGKDYIVKDNQIIIIDEQTGRQLPGRRFGDGLHQSLEAKENLSIQVENQTLASITYQNYFKLYNKLCGCTGTASTEAEEFYEIYNLNIISIPTNKEMIRVDLNDQIFRTEDEKNNAIVNLVNEKYNLGQPILVFTSSVNKSEYYSQLFNKKKN